MEIRHLKDEDFNEVIKDKKVIVDFYADWCGPCKMLAPILEEFKDVIEIIKVDIDDREDIARDYGIMSIPTLLFFKDNKEVKRIIGYSDHDEIQKEIDKL